METVKICDNDLQIKEWNGQRVVTFKDIDRVHKRKEGSAKRNFLNNRKHFIDRVDYFIIKSHDVGEKFTLTYGFNKRAPSGTLFTESGYLMIVKSFTDDLAWLVQRDLVNSYFKLKELAPNSTEVLTIQKDFAILCQQINSMEGTLDYQHEAFKDICQYITINYQQQQELLKMARKRVSALLGGTKTPQYKAWSRTYFKNLWLNLCDSFKCSTYKDLQPFNFEEAKLFINRWNYQ